MLRAVSVKEKVKRFVASSCHRTRMLYFSQLPCTLCHRITLRCDCRCLACDWWDLERNEIDIAKELSYEQIVCLLNECSYHGITQYVVIGGEPLERRDIGAILKSALDLRMETVLCTNGSQLEARVKEVIPYCSLVLVSIDGLAETHDELRGRQESFDLAVRGIVAAKRLDTHANIRIWSQVNKRNHHQIEDMARLARELDVIIDYFPTHLVADYNEDLLLEPEEAKEAARHIGDLKAHGFPVGMTYGGLRTWERQKGYRCNWPQLVLSIDYDGTVLPCANTSGVVPQGMGRVQDRGLLDIYRDPLYKDMVKQFTQCNLCLLPPVLRTVNNVIYRRLVELVEEPVRDGFNNVRSAVRKLHSRLG